MADKPRISQTEWQIMEELWDKAPLSASEIHERLASKTDCSVQTVRSLLERLLRKGAASRKKVHGVWVFHAAMERESCLLRESKSFLERFFDADPVPLFAHLMANDVLTEDDITQLRRILDRRDSEQQGEHEDE